MASKKELLESNISPVNLFISEEPKQEQPQAQEKEAKTERINLLFKKSIMEDITKIAFMKQKSRNDFINILLEEYIQSEQGQEEIKKYNSIFNK